MLDADRVAQATTPAGRRAGHVGPEPAGLGAGDPVGDDLMDDSSHGSGIGGTLLVQGGVQEFGQLVESGLEANAQHVGGVRRRSLPVRHQGRAGVIDVVDAGEWSSPVVAISAKAALRPAPRRIERSVGHDVTAGEVLDACLCPASTDRTHDRSSSEAGREASFTASLRDGTGDELSGRTEQIPERRAQSVDTTPGSADSTFEVNDRSRSWPRATVRG